MNTLPFYIPFVFVLTTALTIFLFYHAASKKRSVLFVLIGVALVEAVVGLTGFFANTDAIPPRIALLIILPFLVIVLLFTTRRGHKFIDDLDPAALTLIHVVRIPVELVLYSLFIQKYMPQLMTFEGKNFDILSGLSAPVVYYFSYVAGRMSRWFLFSWNLLCLLILALTVSIAILSAPTPFQQFGFDQPTRAVLYFPFVWLPGIIVPLVYFSHLVMIRKLWKGSRAGAPLPYRLY